MEFNLLWTLRAEHVVTLSNGEALLAAWIPSFAIRVYPDSVSLAPADRSDLKYVPSVP